MNKPSDKNAKPDSQEMALFLDALQADGVTHRIKQDKIHPRPQRGKQKSQQSAVSLKQRDAGFYFSDEFVPSLPETGPMSYVAEGHDRYLAKQLRRGDFYPDLILDLHGLSKDHAKLELAGLLTECQRKHIRCACVVHGVGLHILKKKIPHYLVQHPAVVAFHQAPLEHGGQGALLVLVDIEEQEYKR